MDTLEGKAAKYLAEHMKEIITEAMAKVYADAYREGYSDCQDSLPCAKETPDEKFIDLGLPSGTLWSRDFLQHEGETTYLPYVDAKKLDIPTEDQWYELITNCNIQQVSGPQGYECTRIVGLNGNVLTLRGAGYRDFGSNDKQNGGYPVFWLRSTTEENLNSAIYINFLGNTGKYVVDIQKMFLGYHLPVRLVKSKFHMSHDCR
jgi:hypothetical protein